MMLRSLAVGAVLVASAEAFAPGAMGLRMSVEPAQVNRKQALQSAGAQMADFQIVQIPASNPGSLCDQAKRFANADIFVSVHGAHLVKL